jgi:CYTH domain-containing protein
MDPLVVAQEGQSHAEHFEAAAKGLVVHDHRVELDVEPVNVPGWLGRIVGVRLAPLNRSVKENCACKEPKVPRGVENAE